MRIDNKQRRQIAFNVGLIGFSEDWHLLGIRISDGFGWVNELTGDAGFENETIWQIGIKICSEDSVTF